MFLQVPKILVKKETRSSRDRIRQNCCSSIMSCRCPALLRRMPYYNGIRLLRGITHRTSTNDSQSIKKIILISESTDVTVNLALRLWMYRKLDLTNQHILFFFINDPCIVFGREKNPWLDCNVHAAEKGKINLIRQDIKSDSITYQDKNSLNMCFFTPRNRHDLTENLDIIKNALSHQSNLKSEINENNILIKGKKYKVSLNLFKFLLIIRNLFKFLMIIISQSIDVYSQIVSEC